MIRRSASRALLTLLAAGLSNASTLAIVAEASAAPTAGAPRTIDGPGATIDGLGGFSVARDGTGAVVYLKAVAGVDHVFVSRLIGGVFGRPDQVDGNLPGASSQPVIATSSGGALAVAFVNGGSLFVVRRAGAVAAYAPPLDLADGAADPALGMTTLGKAYLAFTASGAGAHDVRAAYLNATGTWSVIPGSLDVQPADDAGSGSERPTVAAAGDGIGIVAWGEAGRVYVRRVIATRLSTAVEQVDPPTLGGWPEVSADQPSVSAGGDSSYADIAFREILAGGGSPQSRVLMGRLRGSQIEPVSGIDALSTPGPGGAQTPQVALNEYGRGFMTVRRTDVNQVIAARAAGNGALDSVFRADSLLNAADPYATPGTAGLISTLIAWQQDPGAAGLAEIRVRYAVDGSTLGPEQVLSSPIQGPADAGDGIAAGGDGRGDAAVLWIQGAPGAHQLVSAQLYEPPGGISPVSGFAYLRTARPKISWTPAAASWGPIRYLVSVDGLPVAQTTATALQVPTPLPDGPHSWQVTAVNPVGATSTMRTSRFWTDTVAPVVTLTLSRAFQVGTHVHAYVRYDDAPAPEPPSASSGIGAVLINWGDGTRMRISHSQFHAYARAGRYRVSVAVSDRAGNVTLVQRVITVRPKPNPKPRSGPKKRTGAGSKPKVAPDPRHRSGR